MNGGQRMLKQFVLKPTLFCFSDRPIARPGRSARLPWRRGGPVNLTGTRRSSRRRTRGVRMGRGPIVGDLRVQRIERSDGGWSFTVVWSAPPRPPAGQGGSPPAAARSPAPAATGTSPAGPGCRTQPRNPHHARSPRRSRISTVSGLGRLPRYFAAIAAAVCGSGSGHGTGCTHMTHPIPRLGRGEERPQPRSWTAAQPEPGTLTSVSRINQQDRHRRQSGSGGDRTSESAITRHTVASTARTAAGPGWGTTTELPGIRARPLVGLAGDVYPSPLRAAGQRCLPVTSSISSARVGHASTARLA